MFCQTVVITRIAWENAVCIGPITNCNISTGQTSRGKVRNHRITLAVIVAVCLHAYIVSRTRIQTTQHIRCGGYTVGGGQPVIQTRFRVFHRIIGRRAEVALIPCQQGGRAGHITHLQIGDRRTAGNLTEYNIVNITVVVAGGGFGHLKSNITAIAREIIEISLHCLIGRTRHRDGLHQLERAGLHRIRHHTHLNHKRIGCAVWSSRHRKLQRVHWDSCNINFRQNGILVGIRSRCRIGTEVKTVTAAMRVGCRIVNGGQTSVGGSAIQT